MKRRIKFLGRRGEGRVCGRLCGRLSVAKVGRANNEAGDVLFDGRAFLS
jgi:hypothetical protein